MHIRGVRTDAERPWQGFGACESRRARGGSRAPPPRLRRTLEALFGGDGYDVLSGGGGGGLQRPARCGDAQDAAPQMSSVELSTQKIAIFDCALIATHHAAYDWQQIADHAQLIVDTRNDHIVRA